MQRYLLLLRGINLGKQNKVIMPELREQLEKIGLEEVSSYINTGNLFFSSEENQSDIEKKITDVLSLHYDFSIPFVVIERSLILTESLPIWWEDSAKRKDALFYLPGTTKQTIEALIEDWELVDEDFLIGETALFWRVREEANAKQTAHSKKIMTKPFNQMVTLRNVNTTNILIALLRK